MNLRDLGHFARASVLSRDVDHLKVRLIEEWRRWSWHHW